MAQITTTRDGRRGIQIDMTPMVDLAFLLLTFFILTTTFNDPKVMPLTMPDQSPPSPINDENVLNVCIMESNKIVWWKGLDGEVQKTHYGADGIRKVLLEQRASNKNLMVLVKPMKLAKYENVVDVLDELEIADVERYSIVNFTDDDGEKLFKVESNKKRLPLQTVF